MVDEARRCGECVFYKDGVCRRFPPTKPVDGQPKVSQWQDWCGEFRLAAGARANVSTALDGQVWDRRKIP